MIHITLEVFNVMAERGNISSTNDTFDQYIALIEFFDAEITPLFQGNFSFAFHHFVVGRYGGIPIEETYA